MNFKLSLKHCVNDKSLYESAKRHIRHCLYRRGSQEPSAANHDAQKAPATSSVMKSLKDSNEKGHKETAAALYLYVRAQLRNLHTIFLCRPPPSPKIASTPNSSWLPPKNKCVGTHEAIGWPTIQNKTRFPHVRPRMRGSSPSWKCWTRTLWGPRGPKVL